MNKINKSTSFKIAIAALSVLLVAVSVFAVWLCVKNNRNNAEIERMSGEISKGNDVSSQLGSELESLNGAKDSEAQSYEDRINSESKAHQSKVDELNNIINDLSRQLAAKITTTSRPATLPPVVTPPPVIPAGDKTVYLTFDDGPSPNTPAILEILDRYGVKATFVKNGGSYNKYMKDIVNRGHQIALHSYTHDYATIYASDAAYFADLQKISDLVKNETGVETRVIRFPAAAAILSVKIIQRA